MLAVIDDARRAAGMSQAELGEAVGVSQSQLSKLLRGERAVTMTELAGLCAALDLRLSGVFFAAGL